MMFVKTYKIGLRSVFFWGAACLIAKVTLSVILNYPYYFPPDFHSEFLNGRESYFFGAYQWAFYTHIVSGPISLLLGLFLIFEPMRVNCPILHRYLGRMQVGCVIFGVAPSGVWMARYAAAGALAGVGLGLSGITAAICVGFGFLNARKRRFVDHQRWMTRCFLLLCSAVVVRILGGLGATLVVSWPWYDVVTTWVSWLAPLTIFEILEHFRRTRLRLDQNTVT